MEAAVREGVPLRLVQCAVVTYRGCRLLQFGPLTSAAFTVCGTVLAGCNVLGAWLGHMSKSKRLSSITLPLPVVPFFVLRGAHRIKWN
eukprot:2705407-Amphidinium_carterae.1